MTYLLSLRQSENKYPNEEKKSKISEDTISDVVLKNSIHTIRMVLVQSQVSDWKVIDHDSYSITVYATTKSSPFVQ